MIDRGSTMIAGADTPETGLLTIHWPDDESAAGGVDRFRVVDSTMDLDRSRDMPLNGRMIRGTGLSIDVTFQAIEGSDLRKDTEASIAIDVHATHGRLSDFGEIGSVIDFAAYVRTDEWEILATLHYHECLEMLDTRIAILDRTRTSASISIVGRLKYYDEHDGTPDRRNPAFRFRHDIAKATFRD